MPSIFRKPVAIDKGVYAMSMDEARNAEITMYGQIVERQPTDGWTGKPIPGNYIIQGEFLADLDSISKAKSVTIHMNSLGGDAGVSILIHNRLRELAAKGTALTCIVDGVAMSGGSLIMCACDTVKVNPSSLIMIHQCWGTLFGGYNATELREEAAACEAWDKAQASIYKRKCGLDEAEIARMMAATTYMTGQEAVDKGFADAILEDAEPLNIAASADGRSLFVRGKEFHLCPGMFAPDCVPTAGPEAKAPVNNTLPAEAGEGGNQNMANFVTPNAVQTVSAPSTVQTVSVSGTAQTVSIPASAAQEPAPAVDQVAAERQRLREIDAIAPLCPAELVEAAKYGENPCTAQELAYRVAVQAAANAGNEGKAFLAAMTADSQVAAQVGAAPAPAGNEPNEDSPQAAAAQAKADVEAFKKMKEVR